jgi:hypothetical protein
MSEENKDLSDLTFGDIEFNSNAPPEPDKEILETAQNLNLSIQEILSNLKSLGMSAVLILDMNVEGVHILQAGTAIRRNKKTTEAFIRCIKTLTKYLEEDFDNLES